MLNYNNFKIIRESKIDNKLYHIIDFEKLFYILNNNKIKSYKFSFISTTRNVNMVGYVGDSPTSIFKLELDWNELHTN
jgi:hypothetical protein